MKSDCSASLHAPLAPPRRSPRLQHLLSSGGRSEADRMGCGASSAVPAGADGRTRYQAVDRRTKELVAECESDAGHRCAVRAYRMRVHMSMHTLICPIMLYM